ncbi:amino acid/polyamine/organocation transporter, APC superfamily [Neorhodopirellula lusitana]|uniref:Amino acid/polyamine/organocation transporter, APC superfamily n=1 Tax=Neorhodopirellula lusitana TaxID=445327 RepID=A0ABY1PQ27_9BACT|nr:APC family permease [Neorhodopirellula lusitana]SMP40499.1 amino acid/polyamine/organocation transporter, APC superfamily [Neorhodopirellula lusitana]
MTRWSLATLVIASMVGAGVFTTSGFAIADLGNPHWVMLAWLVGGVIAICGAISYGNLTRLLLDNGGEYLFLSRYAHPAAGFIAGWFSFLAGFTGAGALAAITLEAYAMPDEQRPNWLPPGTIAITATALCTLAHATHTRRGTSGHNLLVAVKLLLIGAFIAISFASINSWTGPPPATPDSSPTVLAFATTVMWISLSYCGFNAAIYVAAEAKQGSSGVAGAMVRAAIGVTLLYLLLNAIFLYGPPIDTIKGQPDIAVIAARYISGDNLANLVRTAIVLALLSSVSSTILAGPRVYAKMAEDGVFPRWFASDVSPPTRSVIMQGIAITVVVCVSSLQPLLAYLGLTLSVCSAAAVSVLLWRRDDVFSIGPGSLTAAWIYVIATAVIAVLAAWHRPAQTIATVATIASGLLVFAVLRALRKRATQDSDPH